MPFHKKRPSGYYLDPEIHALEVSLGDLAALFRGACGNPLRQEEIVRIYHETMRQLYALGWSDIVDADSELPEALMPRAYLDS